MKLLTVSYSNSQRRLSDIAYAFKAKGMHGCYKDGFKGCSATLHRFIITPKNPRIS
ncbi:MAG: hypothetical protein F6J99_32445 [Moorea sp. SIO4G3]|nr:hypothetical protein [Moorena sp. SIO4G3]